MTVRFPLFLVALSLAVTPVFGQVLEIDDLTGEAKPICASLPPVVAVSPKPALITPYQAAIEAAAHTYSLSPALISAIIRQESGFNQNAISPRGAIGLMQLMPATARELGVDPYDPVQNIKGGAAYLRQQLNRFDGRIDLALAAFNAGAGAVNRYGGVPPYRETRAYIDKNLDSLAQGVANEDYSAATGLKNGQKTDCS